MSSQQPATVGNPGDAADVGNVKAPAGLVDFGRAIGPDQLASMKRVRSAAAQIRAAASTTKRNPKG